MFCYLSSDLLFAFSPSFQCPSRITTDNADVNPRTALSRAKSVVCCSGGTVIMRYKPGGPEDGEGRKTRAKARAKDRQ